MIKIQLDEYNNLLDETNALHKESRELINDYIKELEELLEPDGGFHAKLISEKVKLILGMLKGKMLPELESTFDETEKQVLLLGQRLAEGDEERRLTVQWER